MTVKEVSDYALNRPKCGTLSLTVWSRQISEFAVLTQQAVLLA
jgi:hypothetical protein